MLLASSSWMLFFTRYVSCCWSRSILTTSQNFVKDEYSIYLAKVNKLKSIEERKKILPDMVKRGDIYGNPLILSAINARFFNKKHKSDGAVFDETFDVKHGIPRGLLAFIITIVRRRWHYLMVGII